ncbi:hypothetical protein [Rhodococcus sp. NPDC057529]|uniref:hypothetical protein n=1 Tax=Rhodococcus sp. NPDC057529 TaxID=3346158 RepID=UPI003672A8E1
MTLTVAAGTAHDYALELLRADVGSGFTIAVNPPADTRLTSSTETTNGTLTAVELTYGTSGPVARIRTGFRSSTDSPPELPTTALARFVLDNTPDVPWDEQAGFVEDLQLALARVPRFESPVLLDGTARQSQLTVFGGYSMHHLALRERTITLITAYPRRGELALQTT